MQSEKQFQPQAQHYIVVMTMAVIITMLFHSFVLTPLAKIIIHFMLSKPTAPVELTIISSWGEWMFPLDELQIFIWPWLAFGFLDVLFGGAMALWVSMALPSGLGLMNLKVAREFENTRKRIKLQTGMSDAEMGQWFSWSDADIESEGDRRNFQYIVIKEMSHARDAQNWIKRGVLGRLWIGPALRLYMAHHFTEQYSNNVQGAAYMGAANLIIFIGVRGLKFIPATQPSPILFALWLEFSLLILLGVTLAYTEEEERLDKILKELKERTAEQAQRLGSLNTQNELQTQALQNLVRILSGVNTDDVTKMSGDRAKELLSRAIAEGRVDSAVKAAADETLEQAYVTRRGTQH